jgi:hypothetical protein
MAGCAALTKGPFGEKPAVNEGLACDSPASMLHQAPPVECGSVVDRDEATSVSEASLCVGTR